MRELICMGVISAVLFIRFVNISMGLTHFYLSVTSSALSSPFSHHKIPPYLIIANVSLRQGTLAVPLMFWASKQIDMGVWKQIELRVPFCLLLRHHRKGRSECSCSHYPFVPLLSLQYWTRNERRVSWVENLCVGWVNMMLIFTLRRKGGNTTVKEASKQQEVAAIKAWQSTFRKNLDMWQIYIPEDYK